MSVRVVFLLILIWLSVACAPPQLLPHRPQVIVYATLHERVQIVQLGVDHINQISPCPMFQDLVRVNGEWTFSVAVLFLDEQTLRTASGYDPPEGKTLLGYYWDLGWGKGLVGINEAHPDLWKGTILHELGHALGLAHGRGIMEADAVSVTEPMVWSDEHYEKLEGERCLIYQN